MTAGGTGNDALFHALVGHSADTVWVLDADGSVLHTTSSDGASPWGRLDGEGVAAVRRLVEQVRAGRPTTMEVRHELGSGERVHATVFHDGPTAAGVVVRVGHEPGSAAMARELVSMRQQRDDEVRQYILLQGVASAANDARSLIQVLERGRDMLLLIEEWKRAIGFIVNEDGSLTRVYPDAEDEARAHAEDAADPARAAMEREVAGRAVDAGEKVWNDEGLVLAFPIKYESRVYAVAVITAEPPLVRYELIERNADQVAQQLEHVVARELAERSLADARDQAMAASRHKSEFLATVSHEIRTPLNGVIGLNELLLATDLDDEQRKLAHGIQQSGHLLLAQLNDILDFSKIEAGRLVLERVPFDVREVLEQVTTPIAEAAAQKGLAFTTSYSPSLPDLMVGDPTKVSQIFANLLTNSVKFTSSGTVAASVDAFPLEHAWRVTVRVDDTGIGIDKATTDVFQPFQQGDSSTTRQFGGTGLGLAISRELARAMGGDVGFASSPGRGSRFWFTAVFDAASQRSPGPPPDPEPELLDEETHGQRVLVVEDNQVNQLVAVGMLRALGHDVDTADDGVDALDLLEREHYDLILMDVQMPRMDGYAATRAIREREQGRTRVPIAAMTANAVAGERDRCLAAGMDDFLTKPVDPEGLARMMARLTGAASRALPTFDTGSAVGAGTLDVERLAMLRDMDPGDTSYLDRAIGNFAIRSEEALASIREAEEAGDDTQLRFHAHKLVGSAGNLGVVDVADLAREIELLADTGTTAGAASIIRKLDAALEQGCLALLAYRDDYQRGA